MERGHLHKVYQQFAESLINQRNLNYKDKYKRISQILAEKVNEYKQKNPPPNDIIFQNEYTQMQRDIKVFIDLNEELKTTQIFCELKFGMDNKDKVSITLDNGKEFSLRGSVDRVDKIADHQYSVWDYKTGGNSDMEENGYINGCEKIQHILYAIAVEEIFKSKGIDDNPQVIQSGYIFPTEKGTKDGRGGIFRRDPSQKDKWKPALTILMDLIANGAFFVSEKAKCNFCEYSEVCGGETSRNRIKQKIGNFLAQWQKLKDYE